MKKLSVNFEIKEDQWQSWSHINIEDAEVHLHIFRTAGTQMRSGQDTIWVYCKHSDCPGSAEKHQIGRDGQYGFNGQLEGDKNMFSLAEMPCEHIRKFLEGLGFPKGKLEKNSEGIESFIDFLNAIEGRIELVFQEQEVE